MFGVSEKEMNIMNTMGSSMVIGNAFYVHKGRGVAMVVVIEINDDVLMSYDHCLWPSSHMKSQQSGLS